MIGLTHPEALLLAIPLAALLRRHLPATSPVGVALRVLTLGLLVLILAGPYWVAGETGRDIVILIDRSRSVGPRAAARALELAEHARTTQGPRDRVGILSFGGTSAVELAPTEATALAQPQRAVDADGTDLDGAIRAGLALIPEARPGSLLLVSDGEGNRGDPLAAAALARERGVRVDTVLVKRPAVSDLRVEEPAPPLDVAAGQAFWVPAWVTSDTTVEASYRLLRDGQTIAEGRRTFAPGRTRLLFKDRVESPGLHKYTLEIVGLEDRIPENNQATSAMRVSAPPRILCVTPGGRQDRLSRSLALSGLDVVVADAKSAPLSFDALQGFRAVVLENVPAGDLPQGSLELLRRFVEDMGGGLLMTGGAASFGRGGYRKSPIEDVLPVTLEVRREHRKFSLAMALVLDRSGSMAAPVPGGLTKMDLANRGSAAAVELLGPSDKVSVIAVDSEPHIVIPLVDVTDQASIMSKIMGIESMGGGIYTSTGVHAAADILAPAADLARHIVVFADAADAEEPGDLDSFVPQLVAAGHTLSVIALGTQGDSDAAFLIDLAARGQGRCTFVQEPSELPRVFAEETIQVLKSAMVEEPTEVTLEASFVGLGTPPEGRFPTLGGYSIAYPRPEAEVAATSVDTHRMPILAYRQKGLGRTAVFLGEADGKLSGGLAAWEGYGDLFATLGRWIAGRDVPSDVFARVVRRGGEAVLVVEAAEGAEDQLARVEALVAGDRGVTKELRLERVAPDRLEATVPIPAEGLVLPVVSADGVPLRLPPIAAQTSPELMPSADKGLGERTLRRIAAVSGGSLDPAAKDLFQGSRQGRESRSLAIPLALLVLLVVLLEIAERRLALGLSTKLGPALAMLAKPALWAEVVRALFRKNDEPQRTLLAPSPDGQGNVGPSAPGGKGSAGPTADELARRKDMASMLAEARQRAKGGR